MFLCKCFWPCSTFGFLFYCLGKKKHNFVLERFQLLKTQWWVYHLPLLSWCPVPNSFLLQSLGSIMIYSFFLCTNFTSLANFCQLFLLNFVLFSSLWSSLQSILLALFLDIFLTTSSLQLENLLLFFLCLCCPMKAYTCSRCHFTFHSVVIYVIYTNYFQLVLGLILFCLF